MFYLLDKKVNLTSQDVVTFVKKKLGSKKAGHSGTLDPFASGLLIIATEQDTKYLDYFLKARKKYSGIISFGKSTDTHDVDGKVLKEIKNFELDFTKLEKLINKNYLGKIKQIPPNHSAIKLNGKKAYELARNNIEFTLKPVNRIVYSFEIKKTDNKNEIFFEVEVSSGTYIRSLIRDISNDIKIPAHLKELKRTKINSISINQASDMDGEIIPFERKKIIPIKEVKVDQNTMKTLLEGKTINFISSNQEIIFVSEDKEIIAHAISLNVFKIKKRIK